VGKERIHKEKDRVWFTVVLKENDRLIGEAGLLRMFHPWRTTDFTLIIGEKDCWGKGYGTEAALLLASKKKVYREMDTTMTMSTTIL